MELGIPAIFQNLCIFSDMSDYFSNPLLFYLFIGNILNTESPKSGIDKHTYRDSGYLMFIFVKMCGFNLSKIRDEWRNQTGIVSKIKICDWTGNSLLDSIAK
jgi:hypothetical protein